MPFGPENEIMNSIRTRIILALALAFPLALSAWAGVIKGKVTAPDGSPLRGVRITLSDAAGSRTYVLETDRKGGIFEKGSSRPITR